jgi:predicted dehydrogenase
MEKLRVAIVGCDMIVEEGHVPAWQRLSVRADIVAIADRPETAAFWRRLKRWTVRFRFTNYRPHDKHHGGRSREVRGCRLLGFCAETDRA